MSATFEITSSPIAALTGDAALVVGAERDESDDLKVYLGSRHKGVYVVVPAGLMAAQIEEAWRGTKQHLFMRPIPSREALFCDRAEHVTEPEVSE